jgi:hypothetical protein
VMLASAEHCDSRLGLYFQFSIVILNNDTILLEQRYTLIWPSRPLRSPNHTIWLLILDARSGVTAYLRSASIAVKEHCSCVALIC